MKPKQMISKINDHDLRLNNVEQKINPLETLVAENTKALTEMTKKFSEYMGAYKASIFLGRFILGFLAVYTVWANY